MEVPGHTSHAVGAVFSIDGRRLVTAGHDGAVRLWDTQSQQRILDLREFAKQAQCLVMSQERQSALRGQPGQYYSNLGRQATESF